MLVVNGRFVFQASKEEVLADFERLCRLDASQLVDHTSPWESRCRVPRKMHLYRTLHTGQLLSAYFHWPHRVRTRTRWHASAHEVLQRRLREPSFLASADARIAKQGGSAAAFPERAGFKVIERNSALLTVTHFRATVSKHLCDVLQARDVLDFSAGWGDRLTGFLASASVRTITLIDPRRGSLDACTKQHRFVASDKELRTHLAGAQNVMPTLPARSCDLVITSPPYFDLEEYGENAREAEGQIRNRVSTLEQYVAHFLRPVIAHAARVLRPGGLLALNVDDNPAAGVFLCAPTLDVIRALPSLQLVGTAGLRKGRGFGQGVSHDRAPRAEPIFLARRV